MGLDDRIGRGPVALDTSIFIYFIEEHPDYIDPVRPVFAGIHEGRWSATTSAVTLLETLVVPHRAGDLVLTERYESHLMRSRGLRMLPLDAALLRAAAYLRATLGVRTPDALQLAAGLATDCRVFLTNDRRLPSTVGSMEILDLGALS